MVLYIYIYVKWSVSGKHPAFLCWLFGNPSSQDSILHSNINAEWNCVMRNLIFILVTKC
jgi:hypothetical protein